MEIEKKAITLLNQQIGRIEPLRTEKRFSANFSKWKRDTEIIIEKIFQNTSRHVGDFKEISYIHVHYFSVEDSTYQQEYIDGLDEAKEILNSMIEEINEFGLENPEIILKPDSLRIIESICNRFHLVARQLRARHESRETLDIQDEYDVQDLFHALLHLHFDDIRSEEWTGSYAGKGSRMDFLLQDEQIGIELKKTRKGLANKEVSDQLIIDKERYKKKHPDCRCLICFVYDPEERITNPIGFENDLKEEAMDFKAIVIVAPRLR